MVSPGEKRMSVFGRVGRFVDSTASLIASPARQRQARAAIYLFLLFMTLGIPYSLTRHVQTSGLYLVSVAREKKEGDRFAGKIEGRMTFLDKGDARTAYVEEIGGRIAGVNNPWNVEFSFAVVENQHVMNAFALPGGRIYITTGMLDRLDNEAELASVLAHEVAHVSQRHYARNMGRKMMISWVKKFLGGTDEVILETGSFFTENFAVLGMRREYEFEADRTGILTIHQLGYDPAAGLTLAEKLVRQEGKLSDYAKALALTHPPSRERMQAMVEFSEALSGSGDHVLGEDRYKEVTGR